MTETRNAIFHFERADGKKILIGGKSKDRFACYKAVGLDPSGMDLDFATSKNPQIHNTYINAIKDGTRMITLTFDCEGQYRSMLGSFFNPYIEGKLVCTWNGITKWIEYRPYPIEMNQKNTNHVLDPEINLFCSKPFWKSMDDYGYDIADETDLIYHPMSIGGNGFTSDYKTITRGVEVENDGDISLPLKIVFTATSSLSNPRIILNSNQFIQYDGDMVSGDVVVFDTGTNNGKILATKNGVNVLNNTNPGSNFFMLPLGESELTYDCSEPDRVKVNVFFTPEYFGI